MRKTIAFLLVFGAMVVGAFALTWIIPRPTPRGTVDDASLKKLFRPRLGNPIPPDLTFRDESGKSVTLGEFGKDRPYILVPAYLRCPSLCNLVLNDLVSCLRLIPTYSVGKDYDVVVVSFDAREDPDLARAKKDAYVEEYARPGTEAGWHFLTGEQKQIDRLLAEIGYTVVWDEGKQEFAHASGIVVCSPDGVVARYFPGLDYRPLYVRLALAEAGQGTITPGIMDQVMLPCFRFDTSKGQYSAAVLFIVKVAGGMTMAGLFGMWLGMSWRRRRKPDAAQDSAHSTYGTDRTYESPTDTPTGVPAVAPDGGRP